MTILHAGGKFGGGGYAVSGGLHGVGISVVNALSARVDTEVRRQGHVWRHVFADGGKPAGRPGPGRGDRRRPAPRRRSSRIRRSSRPPTSTSRRFVPASSRWRSSTRACGSRSPTSASSGRTHAPDGDDVGPGRRQTPKARVTAELRTVVVQVRQWAPGLRPAPELAKKVELVHPDVIAFEAEDTERQASRSRWRCSGRPPTPSPSTPTPTPSTRTRAARTRRASARR